MVDNLGMLLPEEEASSAVTKYLCAAAYLDPKFASTVVGQVLNEEHRFVAPSLGADVVAVARHCLAARRREAALQAILAGLLIVGYLALGSDRPSISLLCFLAAWVALSGETLYRRYGIVGRRLAKDDLDADFLTLNDGVYRDRLKELAEDQREGNVTVYSGYKPFVGSGFTVQGWSFVVDLTRRTHQPPLPQPPPVDLVELHDFVAARLRRLPLPGLQVEDRLFVNGQEIRKDPRFLPDPMARPVSRVAPSVVRSYIAQPTRSVRHYLCVRAADWRGELIVSVFLRFVPIGGHLFAEANYCLLPALKEEYHEVDAIVGQPTVRQVMRTLRQSLLRTPMASLRAIPASAAHVFAPLLRQSSERAEQLAIRENESFDYGGRASIRELGTSGAFRRYFQRVDKEMYLKLLEHQILDLVARFLEDHHVDTSELRRRGETIVNNGIMLSGNASMTADAVAGGPQASATSRLVDSVRQGMSGD